MNYLLWVGIDALMFAVRHVPNGWFSLGSQEVGKKCRPHFSEYRLGHTIGGKNKRTTASNQSLQSKKTHLGWLVYFLVIDMYKNSKTCSLSFLLLLTTTSWPQLRGWILSCEKAWRKILATIFVRRSSVTFSRRKRSPISIMHFLTKQVGGGN